MGRIGVLLVAQAEAQVSYPVFKLRILDECRVANLIYLAAADHLPLCPALVII